MLWHMNSLMWYNDFDNFNRFPSCQHYYDLVWHGGLHPDIIGIMQQMVLGLLTFRFSNKCWALSGNNELLNFKMIFGGNILFCISCRKQKLWP